ncbi:HDOD domain-containing protein [Chromobacterium haemolyticum]|nr:HDOD domain-containing protein [Chromobacterium haemolyticum]
MPSNELLSRARHLRSLGFGISLDDFSFESPAAAFLELANYVKLDIQHQDTNRFQMLASRLRSYPVIRIAERVETHAQFHLCKELGMDGFQGFYFAQPETLSAKVIHPSFRNTLELLNLLRLDADIRDVEQVLKRDLALSYKLLRYVNSAAAGLNTSISSFSHAVTVLGYQKLYRWLTLLLVTASEEGHAPPALQKNRRHTRPLHGVAGQSPRRAPRHLRQSVHHRHVQPVGRAVRHADGQHHRAPAPATAGNHHRSPVARKRHDEPLPQTGQSLRGRPTHRRARTLRPIEPQQRTVQPGPCLRARLGGRTRLIIRSLAVRA